MPKSVDALNVPGLYSAIACFTIRRRVGLLADAIRRENLVDESRAVNHGFARG